VPAGTIGVAFLISSREFGDRAGIAAEREEAPLLRAVIGQRNSGIVLDDRRAIGEKEVAHRGEVGGIQRYDALLIRLFAGRKRRAKFQESTGLDARIGKIGKSL